MSTGSVVVQLTLALMLTAFAGPAVADAQPRLLVILVPASRALDTSTEMLRLAACSQLAAHEVAVVSMPVEGEIDPLSASRSLKLSGAVAAMWVAESGDVLFLLVPGLDDQVRQRPLPGADEGWAVTSHVAATMLASELQPLFVPVALPPPTPEAVEITDLEGNDPDPSAPPRSVGMLSLAYVGATISRNGPWASGIALEGRWLLAGLVGPYLGLDVVSPIDLGEGDARLVRWPVRLGASCALPLGRRVDLMASLGLLVEVWHVRGLDQPPQNAQALQPNVEPGVAWSAGARWRALPWLAPHLEIGGTAHSRPLSFSRDGETLASRDAVNLRVVVGLSFISGGSQR